MATQKDVRRIALSLPQTSEAADHFGFGVLRKGKWHCRRSSLTGGARGIGLSASPSGGAGRSHDGFVPDREVHRAGDEAFLVGFPVQRGRLVDHVR
jgi:hypothetical protein